MGKSSKLWEETTMTAPTTDDSKAEARHKRKGYIKLDRSFETNPFWQERRTFSKAEAWIFLLIRANWKPTRAVVGMRTIEIPRGSLLTSTVSLSEQWLWSRGKVGRFLDVLKSDQMVRLEASSAATLIHIVNYNTYQGDDPLGEQPIGQPTNIERTSSSTDHKKERTDYTSIRKYTSNNDLKEHTYGHQVAAQQASEGQQVPSWIVKRPGIYDQTGEGLIYLSDEEIQSRVALWGDRRFDKIFESFLLAARKDPQQFQARYKNHAAGLDAFYSWRYDRKEVRK